MADFDDDQYDDVSDHHSSDHSSHSASPYSGNKSKTPDFSTMMISRDGKFFGVDLPQDMVHTGRALFPTLLTWLSNRAYHFGTRFGPTGGKVAGYGAALIQQEYEIYETVRDTVSYLHKLNAAIRPLAKSGGATLFSGDNEFIEDARGKAAGLFGMRFLDTAVGTIAAGPAVLNIWNKQTAKNHDLQLQYDRKKAEGDPDKLAAIYEKEIAIGASKTGLNSTEVHAAKETLIKKYRQSYVDEFATFKKANTGQVQKELNTVLNDLKPSDIRYSMKNLKYQGFDTEQLSRDIERRWDRQENKYVDPDVAEVIKKFRKASKNQMDRITERELKSRFVQQKGVALDDSWLAELEHGRDNNAPPTIRRQLEQKIEKFEEAQHKLAEETSPGGKHDKEFDKMIDGAKGFGAGVAAVFLRKLFGGEALQQYAKPMALDRVIHLRKTLEPPSNAPDDWQPPEEVPGIVLDGSKNIKENDMGYVRYVHEIFLQHQKDRKWPEIGKHFLTHFEDAHWKDAAIMELPDDELTPYEYAIKTITQRVKTGRMDAIAIIDLGGNKNGKKIVQGDGRSFGPHGAGKDNAAIKEAIGKLIDEKTATLHAGQKQTEAQINENLGNFVFSVEDSKKALESKDLDLQQQAFIFTLFSDVVGSDEKLCNKIGISKDRCQELRKESKERFNTMLDGTVNVLADMIENEPEKLKEHLELTKEKKDFILSLAQRATETGKSVVDSAENREQVKLLEAIGANVAMTLGREKPPLGEDGKPNGFWQRLVASARQKIENRGKPQRRENVETDTQEQLHDSNDKEDAEAANWSEREERQPESRRKTLRADAAHDDIYKNIDVAAYKKKRGHARDYGMESQFAAKDSPEEGATR